MNRLIRYLTGRLKTMRRLKPGDAIYILTLPDIETLNMPFSHLDNVLSQSTMIERAAMKRWENATSYAAMFTVSVTDRRMAGYREMTTSNQTYISRKKLHLMQTTLMQYQTKLVTSQLASWWIKRFVHISTNKEDLYAVLDKWESNLHIEAMKRGIYDQRSVKRHARMLSYALQCI